MLTPLDVECHIYVKILEVSFKSNFDSLPDRRVEIRVSSFNSVLSCTQEQTVFAPLISEQKLTVKTKNELLQLAICIFIIQNYNSGRKKVDNCKF